jgi:hypothetical protein
VSANFARIFYYSRIRQVLRPCLNDPQAKIINNTKINAWFVNYLGETTPARRG